MRHISFDPKLIKLPAGWVAKVAALKVAVSLELDAKKRSALIDENSEIWKDIKQELAKIFNYKCWYSESPQGGTDVDVDHYRPKKRVAEVSHGKVHPGYWWLAFEISNYRYSSIVTNRRRRDVLTDNTGGKADHFPIVDEVNRAWDANGDHEAEQPYLLDPCKAGDVALVTFKLDGEAMARFDEAKKPRLFRRADQSIGFYHLNHSDFVRGRIALRDEMDTLMRSARKYFDRLETGDAVHDHAYEETMKALRKMREFGAPYSSFCVAYLENFKHEDALIPLFI